MSKFSQESQSNQLNCEHRMTCGSCSSPEGSLAEQKLKKLRLLREALLAAKLIENESFLEIPFSTRGGSLRERVDLVFEDGRLGYFQKNSSLRTVFQLKECALLTPELLAWVLDFQKINWPIKKGSVRLRVSPSGLRGVWLDFANVDVAHLLKQETDLQALLEQGVVVEIGQKRKRLRRTSEGLKLREPSAEIWTETYLGQQAFPLHCLVGNFSQTGRWAHRQMATWVEERLQGLKALSVIEFGSGVGTLSIPASGQGRKVLACEMDQLACDCLEKSLAAASKKLDLEIFRGDFQLKSYAFKNSYDAFLINPPRSGMGKFAETLGQLSALPSSGLCMSCYLESFVRDALQLQMLGFSIDDLQVVDQFPWTDHFEILAVFKRQ